MIEDGLMLANLQGVSEHTLATMAMILFGNGRAEGRDGERGSDRDVVRVEVLPVPAEDEPPGRDAIHAQAQPLSDVAGRLLTRPRLEVHLRH